MEEIFANVSGFLLIVENNVVFGEGTCTVCRGLHKSKPEV